MRRGGHIRDWTSAVCCHEIKSFAISSLLRKSIKILGQKSKQLPADFRLLKKWPKWLRHLPLEQKIPGSNPACAGNFPESSHTSDLKIGTPVATMPGAWRQCWDWLAQCQYTVTGWDGKFDLITSVFVWQHVNFSEQIRPWVQTYVAGTLSSKETT